MGIASRGWGMAVVKRNSIRLAIWRIISGSVTILGLRAGVGGGRCFLEVGVSCRGRSIGRTDWMQSISDLVFAYSGGLDSGIAGLFLRRSRGASFRYCLGALGSSL